jgi:hypothetical protein
MLVLLIDRIYEFREMDSGALIYVPSFTKVSAAVQKLIL